jgi:hypothetical protein
MASARIKGLGNGVGTYSVVKAIAEEVRGLAVEFDVPVWSATQINRSGAQSSDGELTDTSECIYVNERIALRDGTIKKISEVRTGDQLIANDGYKTVTQVHHKKMKDCIKIITKNGKEIIVSKDHIFPTVNGRLSYNTGLGIGSKINSK